MRLRVKIGVFASGERFPMLVDGETGEPQFLPTVFAITSLRARGAAANTIDQALRAVLHLHASADRQGIDLHERVRLGRSLSISEIDAIVADARVSLSSMAGNNTGPLSNRATNRTQTHKIEKLRASVGSTEEVEPISLAFAANRLRYMRNYLDWLYLRQLTKLPIGAERLAFDAARKQTLEMFAARIPAVNRDSDLGKREGMPPEYVDHLRSVIAPTSPNNPWARVHVRHRNQLIILWALYLGLRRGEMLGIRIDDIDFRKLEVTIRRRADDVDDPRKRQPNAKTRARRLPLTPELVGLTEDYVMLHRKAERGAKRTSFLFVADRSGRPLSNSGMTKVYEALRDRHPTLFADFSWHVLRHTWNDRFSETMDARGIPEDEEKKQRSYLMGWTDTSGTAASYTRRHIRTRAREVSLKLQASLLGTDDDGGK